MQNAANSWRRWAAVACVAILAGCTSGNQKPPQQARIDVYHVDFAKDSYAIDPAGQQVINAVAGALGDAAAARVTVVGRTDATGSPAFNMQLSQKRAAAVHDALIATGKIKRDQLETAWTGERPQSAAGGAVEPRGDRVVDIYIH
jgi:outer membrane protein OmpA-like peptidoglycan-associated protein